MLYTISNNDLSVTVNSYGAELTNVIFKGRERLWQNSDGKWSDHAPVLFPVCGRCGIKVYGRSYPVDLHGFASNCNFALTEKKDNLLRFSITSSCETKKHYPFSFIFDVIYEIVDNCLYISYEVENPSENEYLPFSCGGHESFAIEDDLEKYSVVFEKEETLVNLIHDDNGRLTGETAVVTRGKTLDFGKHVLVDDKTFIFKKINSRKVVLTKTDGNKECEVAFDGFQNLLFWRPDGSKVICIEPWLNLPDNNFGDDCEFSDKYGIQHLPPREKVKFTRYIKYY